MLRIECPYCGVRDQVEFQFGGEANVTRPQAPEAVTDAEWAAYLFYRENIKGMHTERWVHSFGCRQWFLVERDTATHDIRRTCRLDEATAIAPGAPGNGA